MALPNLTTLERVKQYLELEATNFDPMLENLLAGASAFVRTYTRKTWTRTRVTELYSGTGHAVLTMGRGDLTAVVSASAYEGPTYALDTLVAARQAIVLRRGVWKKGRANVTVSYECGADEVPDDIQQAVVYLVALRYRQKDWIGLASRGMGPESVSFSVDELPEQVRGALDERAYVVPIQPDAILEEVALP